jgi:hypothetical protein
MPVATSSASTRKPPTSSPPDYRTITHPSYSAKEPYHHRHLVLLPNSWRLGLENFTIHPETPPVTFTPERLSSGNFALRGTYTYDTGATEMSYIAALIAKDGARPITMGLVFAPAPDQGTIDNEPEACPDGFECKADVWTGVAGGELKLGSEAGVFEPIKEAPEGWVVYWKGSGDGKVYSPVRLEVVPVEKSGSGY